MAPGCGLLDLSLGMLGGPSILASPTQAALAFGAASSLILTTYLALALLAAPLLLRHGKLEPLPLAASLGAFVFSGFIGKSLSGLALFSSDPADWFKLALLAMTCLLGSVAIYPALRFTCAERQRSRIVAVLALSLPMLLAATTILIWLQKYQIGLFRSWPSAAAGAGYAAVCLVAVLLLYRLDPRRWSRVAVASLLVSLAPLSLFLLPASRAERPLPPLDGDHPVAQVILVTVDTLRPDALSSYASPGAPTPHIDRLARDGVLFTQAIAPSPWTLPSLASIMTGLDPSVHLAMGRTSRLLPAVQTLAEYFRDAGYLTGAIGYNPFLSPAYNLSQGFLDYQHFPDYSYRNPMGMRILARLFPARYQEEASTDELTELVSSWLEANRHHPFFLWIHYYDPHYPYAPPARFLPPKPPPSSAIGTGFTRVGDIRIGSFVPSAAERRWIRELYDAEVRYVDSSFGRLLETLEHLGLYDGALVVFTSDHGEEFWEHSGLEHGHSLYHELLWVPLIIKLPHGEARGRAEHRVSVASVMPTILEISGIEYEAEGLSRPSLAPLLGTASGEFHDQPAFSTGVLYGHENRESLYLDNWKYIRFLLTGREELYDLSTDPHEQASLAHPPGRDLLRARASMDRSRRVASRLRTIHGLPQHATVTLADETVEKLRALGYFR